MELRWANGIQPCIYFLNSNGFLRLIHHGGVMGAGVHIVPRVPRGGARERCASFRGRTLRSWYHILAGLGAFAVPSRQLRQRLWRVRPALRWECLTGSGGLGLEEHPSVETRLRPRRPSHGGSQGGKS